MKANETKIIQFLEQYKTQFVIPVYQRNYDWSIPQCEQLLNDILDIGNNDNITTHFIGGIVFIHDDLHTVATVRELTIIDGQQRLTTITLVYLAIYHLAKKLGIEETANEILNTYIVNQYVKQDEQKVKLKLTSDNDRALKYLIRGDRTEEITSYSKIIDNFNYFEKNIIEDNYKVVLKGLEKLIFVEISLERGKDDPQRIFESLNSTGLDLSQADLIRNYILMDLNLDEQQRVYQDYWLIIENLARDEVKNISKVSDFIRDYLTLIHKNIPNKSKVYEEFKNKYPDKVNLEEVLKTIKRFAKYYNKLINPKNEKDTDIRKDLEYINRLEINVAYPFLMQVYFDFEETIIDKHTFIQILLVVQSFVWRRFIIGLSTNSLNKIFMNLYEKIDTNNYLFSLQKALLQKKGSQRFPNNKEVLDALKFKDVYNIKSKNRTYLLEKLEYYQNFEPVILDNKITIEHIFPQNPDPQWLKDLGKEEFDDIKNNYLHTLANLTLSGVNAQLKNKPFLEKRDLKDYGYKYSNLNLNKYLEDLDKWDKSEIQKRFNDLAKNFLKIWCYPDIDINDKETEEVNIFDADEPKGKKLEYAIFCDEKLQIKEVAKLYAEVFKKLFEQNSEIFFNSDLGPKIILKDEKNKNSLRQSVSISNNFYIEGNLDSNSKFEKIKYALKLFDLEEELIIKYTK
ncbi:DUF262 domain-containing protein [Cyanobacterium sp. IPPAS B-1200]|uniref:DUF262 domain-containing protein n=1 Tax=Cyanobacterium sp. IPPAS B-1200 TaxID=1562720 RepID=UPI00085251C6|nr:DUF262 domain-containing protein [Cyanobacterium sp. IPPAS B-1200]OEJ79127.1 hypothetical protein A5482_10885 [Cyanobacterium sp. IPPAS B-1200]